MKYLILSLSLLLAACSKDEVAGGGTVPQEREIRMDIMSHVILSRSINRYFTDTLQLLDKALDKSAALPAHVVDTNLAEGVNSVFYPAQVEPTEFDAYLHIKRKFKIVELLPDEFTHQVSPDRYSGASMLLRGPDMVYAFMPHPAAGEIIRKISGPLYLKGKGFYLYDFAFDMAEGEIVIRYR